MEPKITYIDRGQAGARVTAVRAAAVAALLLAVTAGAAGCADEEPTPGTAAASQSAAAGTDAGGAASADAGNGGLGAASVAPSSPAPAVVETATELTLVMLPSKNIGCAIGADMARCDIVQKNWKAPAKPADCDADYGAGVIVEGAGPGRLACISDSVLGGQKVLAYGHALRVGKVLCESRESGVRCQNDGTGHGFTLAREAYTVF